MVNGIIDLIRFSFNNCALTTLKLLSNAWLLVGETDDIFVARDASRGKIRTTF